MKNTRKVLIAVVALVLSALMAVAAVAAFPDVKPNDKYADSIHFLQALEVVEGDETGKFDSARSITRAEFVKMLYVTLTGTTDVTLYDGVSVFLDVPTGEWYTGYINWAYAFGLVEGYGDGNFGPNDSISIAQVVKMLTVIVTGNNSLEFPYGYIDKADSLGILDLVKDTLTNVSKEARRDETCQLIVNIVNLPCAMLGGATPMSKFDIGSTALDGKMVILVGTPDDTNNGEGQTKIEKANEYAFATLANGDFEYIQKFELDTALNLPLGSPVTLIYKKGAADGWQNASKVLEVQKGYVSSLTAKASEFTPTYDTAADKVVTFDDGTQGYGSVTYTLKGQPYIVEEDFEYANSFITKTANGGIRAAHNNFYYVANAMYSNYDWDLSGLSAANDTARKYRTEDRGAGKGASGLAELGRILTADNFTFYDTDGDGAYEFIWANPDYTCMAVETLTATTVELGSTAGNCEYSAGLSFPRAQLKGSTVKEGDHVHVTVKTGIDGKPVYTARLAPYVQGEFTGGKMTGLRMNYVTVGGRNLYIGYCNIEHGAAEYKQLYTRNGLVTAQNVGKTYKVVLAPHNNTIGRVVEILPEEVVPETIKYGALNLAKVVDFSVETVKGEWLDTYQYKVVLEDMKGVKTTYTAAADMKTVVGAAYEWLDNVSAIGNAWLKQNDKWNVQLVYNSQTKQYQAAMVGAYVHYEVNKDGQVTLLMALDDIMKGYDVPTDAALNGYNYAVTRDRFDWVSFNTAFKGESSGYIFRDPEALVFMTTSTGLKVVKLADVEDFKAQEATILTLNSKAVVIFMNEVAVKEPTAVLDFDTVAGRYVSYYYRANTPETYGDIFVTITTLAGETKTLQLAGVNVTNHEDAARAIGVLMGNAPENALHVFAIDKNGMLLDMAPLYYGNGTNIHFSFGALTQDFGVFYEVKSIIGGDATQLKFAEGALYAKLASNVKVYVIKNDATVEIAGLDAAEILAVAPNKLSAGDTSKLYVKDADGKVKPVIYRYIVNADGIAEITEIIVYDKLHGTGAADTAVTATFTANVKTNSPYYNTELSKLVFPYGTQITEELLFGAYDMQYELFEDGAPVSSGNIAFAALDFGTITTAQGINTVEVSTVINGITYSATLEYGIEGAPAIPESGEFEIVVADDSAHKVDYTWDSTNKNFGEPNIAGLKLILKEEGKADVALESNQFSLITDEIDWQTEYLEIRALGKIVKLPINVVLHEVESFVVATPYHNFRTNSPSNGRCLISEAGTFAIAPMASNTSSTHNTKATGWTVYKQEGELMKGVDIEDYIGLPVKAIYADSAKTELLSIQPYGDKRVVSIDDAVYSGGKYYFGDEEFVFESRITAGRTWGISTLQFMSSTPELLTTLQEAQTKWKGFGNFTFVDTDGNGQYDWAYHDVTFDFSNYTLTVSGTTLKVADYPHAKDAFPMLAFEQGSKGWIQDGAYGFAKHTGIGGKYRLTSITAASDVYAKFLISFGTGSASGQAYYLLYDATTRFDVVKAELVNPVMEKDYVVGQAIPAEDLPMVMLTRKDGSTVCYALEEGDISTSLVLAAGETSKTFTATVAGKQYQFTVSGFSVKETPTDVKITLATEGKKFTNGDKLTKDDFVVKAFFGANDFTGTVVNGYTLNTEIADIDNPSVSVEYLGVSVDLDITVEKNIKEVIIVATRQDNKRIGSAAIVANATSFAYKNIGDAINNQTYYTYNLASGVTTEGISKGTPAKVELDVNGKVCAITPYTPVYSGLLSAAGTYLSGADARLESEYNKYSYKHDNQGQSAFLTKKLSTDYGKQDVLVTLYDLDGNGNADYAHSEFIWSGKVAFVDAANNLISVVETYGSESWSGWYQTGKRQLFVNASGAQLAVGDIVNFTVDFNTSKAAPANSGYAAFNAEFTVLNVITPETVYATDVVNTNTTDITFKVGGVDYTWSDKWGAQTYADGVAGAVAGRNLFVTGQNGYYKIWRDMSGYVIKAEQIPEETVIGKVSASVMSAAGGSITVNSVQYTVKSALVETITTSPTGKWFKLTVVGTEVAAATELTTQVILATNVSTEGGVTFGLPGVAVWTVDPNCENISTFKAGVDSWYKIICDESTRTVYATISAKKNNPTTGDEVYKDFLFTLESSASYAVGTALSDDHIATATIKWSDSTTHDIPLQNTLWALYNDEGTDYTRVDTYDITDVDLAVGYLTLTTVVDGEVFLADATIPVK